MNTDLAATITHLPTIELLPIVSQSLDEGVTWCDVSAAEKIGRSAGLATTGIFRVAGRAHTESGERSWSAVVKVLGPPEHSRPQVDYEPMRELAVYRSGAFSELSGGVRCARCYAIEERDGLVYLWLEDLSDAPQPPWKSEHYVATAHHLGKFNARWSEDALPRWDWLSRKGFRDSFRNPYYQERYERFLTLQDHHLVRLATPPDVLAGLTQLWEDTDTLLPLAESAPKGVCHLDCHTKNLFPIQDSQHGSYTVAVDWTKVGVSHYGIDIGHMLASAMKWLELSPDQAVALVDPVFDAYVAGLAEVGWSDDEDQVRLSYFCRLGCEAIRDVGILTNIVTRPEAATRIAKQWMAPLEEICDRWADVHRFFLRCHDEAMGIARLRS